MLFDRTGQRKYLTAEEWDSFLESADVSPPAVRSFCWTLALTGARLSEVRALTGRSVDPINRTIVIECLKRRSRGIFRAVPVPSELIALLGAVHSLSWDARDDLTPDLLWPWCRTTAWAHVKTVCLRARLAPSISTPKALRHAFGVRGVADAGVPLGTLKKWLGHARLDSTIVYTEAVGNEERALAERMWARHFRLVAQRKSRTSSELFSDQLRPRQPQQGSGDR